VGGWCPEPVAIFRGMLVFYFVNYAIALQGDESG
jgi:hypothetical protein